MWLDSHGIDLTAKTRGEGGQVRSPSVGFSIGNNATIMLVNWPWSVREIFSG